MQRVGAERLRDADRTIDLGSAFPAAIALDAATGTLYVADANGAVDVLNVSRCNATSSASCAAPVKSIADPQGPIAVDVDIATDTVSAANGANELNDTVSVINGSTCNAGQSPGCGQTPATVIVGFSPQWDLVDQATNTIYVANALSGSVSLIDGNTCSATHPAGCSATPTSVLTGTGDNFLALDASRHTLFSLNQDIGTMSELDVNSCNAQHTSGCPLQARNAQVPFDPPSGENANSFALVPATGTAYLVSAGGASLLEPESIAICNAQDTSGCRIEAPRVVQHEFSPVVDTPTHTLYAGNLRLAQIDVIDADTCRAGDLDGCAPVAEIPSLGAQARLGAIDDTTHTLYAGNWTPLAPNPGTTISVINIAHCNATDTSDCTAPAAQITVGPVPGTPVLNPVTHTLYDTYGAIENGFAVIDTRHCNGQDSSGCDATPVTMPIPAGSNLTALSVATDTIYQPSYGPAQGAISVINGATCNATDHSGCGQIAATFSVGPEPYGVAVNDKTHSFYVATGVFGDMPGSVSIINTRTCNATHPSSCARHWPAITIGRTPWYIGLNSASDYLYISDFGSAAVSVIDGNRCNARTTNHCPKTAPMIATEGGPDTLTVDPQNNTVYTNEDIGHPIIATGFETFGVFAGTP